MAYIFGVRKDKNGKPLGTEMLGDYGNVGRFPRFVIGTRKYTYCPFGTHMTFRNPTENSLYMRTLKSLIDAQQPMSAKELNYVYEDGSRLNRDILTSMHAAGMIDYVKDIKKWKITEMGAAYYKEAIKRISK